MTGACPLFWSTFKRKKKEENTHKLISLLGIGDECSRDFDLGEIRGKISCPKNNIYNI